MVVGAEVERLADVGATRRCRRVEPLALTITATGEVAVAVLGDFERGAPFSFVQPSGVALMTKPSSPTYVLLEVPVLEQFRVTFRYHRRFVGAVDGDVTDLLFCRRRTRR